MKKQSYIVIGLNDFGKHIVHALSSTPIELLVMDRDPKRLEEVSDLVLDTVCADAADPDVLSQLSIASFDGAVIDTAHDLERKVLITMQLKELGVPNIIVKAASELEGRVLHRLGADRVVQPDREAGLRVANHIAKQKYFEAIELPQNYGITEHAVPSAWFGRSIRQLDIRAHYGVTVLGIHREGDFLLNPSPDLVLQSGDIAVLLGETGQLNGLHDHFA